MSIALNFGVFWGIYCIDGTVLGYKLLALHFDDKRLGTVRRVRQEALTERRNVWPMPFVKILGTSGSALPPTPIAPVFGCRLVKSFRSMHIQVSKQLL